MGAPTPPKALTSDRAALGDCAIFPADNEWNRDVSKDPVDPNSDKYMASMNAGTTKLHPDFGSSFGIPWIAVPGSEPKVPMSFSYADESDPGPYPFPADAPIEGGPNADGDRHVIVVDRDECKLYEGYACAHQGSGWKCDAGAVFNLKSNALRPAGWTSADAAGLPIFPGLARHSEATAGEIKHALRFTVKRTQKGYVYPATHEAGSTTDTAVPPMGLRVRLKASFDTSRFSGATLAILKALKTYGMLLADNGSDWYISGEPNSAWDDDELDALKSVPASAFEVVKLAGAVTK